MVESIIREMTPRDYLGLMELAASNYGLNYQKRLAEEFWQTQHESKDTVWLVAEPQYRFFEFFDFLSKPVKNRQAVQSKRGHKHTPKITGAIGLSQAGDCVKLHGLMVHPDHQHNGIGRRLFMHGLEIAEALDVNCIIGYARCAHTKSQEILEEFGFSPWGFLPNRIPKLSSIGGSEGTNLESLMLYGKVLDLRADENMLAGDAAGASYAGNSTNVGNSIKIDAHMKKIRITSTDSEPGKILSEKLLYALLETSTDFYIEVEVPENTPCHEMMSLFFYEPRTFAPVAVRPCPALQNNMIRYASWKGDFPSEEKLSLTSMARAVYRSVRDAYYHEFKGHYLELGKRFLEKAGEKGSIQNPYAPKKLELALAR